jgi:hypothetical protein
MYDGALHYYMMIKNMLNKRLGSTQQHANQLSYLDSDKERGLSFLEECL